jgi:hypothetical protein
MRHAALRAILCVPFFFASYASVDNAADRVASGHTIAMLNESSPHDLIFTGDGKAASEWSLLP